MHLPHAATEDGDSSELEISRCFMASFAPQSLQPQCFPPWICRKAGIYQCRGWGYGLELPQDPESKEMRKKVDSGSVCCFADYHIDPLGHPFLLAMVSRGTAGQHCSQLSSFVSSFPPFYNCSGHSPHKTTAQEEW